jgi:hypothetical protein
MTDPIHAEKLFRKLNRELKDHPSIRHRYTLIREFLKQLNGDFARFESYLVQLQNSCLYIPVRLAIADSTPNSLNRMFGFTMKLRQKLTKPGNQQTFEKPWKS